ncbi:hypothetical protein [Streptomyces sp. NPDC088733]|uniref:hypothetical protein n=1 Tax=Streptomyces sp. NPDC088733 TaxID=3365880 RepID=UPI003812A492
MRARLAVTTLSIAVAVATAATACGTVKELTTAQKVQGAFTELGNSNAVTLDFRFNATVDQVLALDAQDTSSAPKLTKTQAKQLAGLGITVSLKTDKLPLKEALKGDGTNTTKVDPSLNMALAVHTGDGTNLAEVRAVSGKEYVKFNLAAVAKFADTKTAASGLNDITKAADSLPASMAPLKRLLKGDWVSIDPEKFAKLAKQLSGKTTPSPAASLNASQQQKLKDALTNVFKKNVTLADKGTANGLDTVEVKAKNTRGLINDIQDQVFPVLSDIPGFDSLPTSAPTDAPSIPVTAAIQLNENDGSLNNITFDLGQFDTKHKGTHIPLVLGFKNTATTATAPAGATEFDPNALKDMLGPLLGAGTPGQAA